ncbi:hypothetical protein EBR03_03860 [bacterium]|nr:hypothetical protein [bacterium]
MTTFFPIGTLPSDQAVGGCYIVSDIKARPIQRLGVIGSGTMGNGIAQVAAASGYDVVLFDISSLQLEKAVQAISKSLSKLAEKGKLQESPVS